MNDTERLSHRVLKGSFWILSIRIIGKILSFARIVILARILSPNDFGLMGIAMLTLMALETFSLTGLGTALVQKKGDFESYLDSTWTVNMLRGIILFGIVYIIAPFTAAFFKEPSATLIIRVMGVSMLITGFTSMGITCLRKELEFNKLFIYHLTSALADFIVAVSIAFALKNVWALVFGKIAGSFAGMVTSYLIHPYRPRISIEREKAGELFTYGRWILGTSMLFFLLNQGGDILVGRLLGATMLGFYTMAMRIPNLIATEITSPLISVTFPAFSKIQSYTSDLKRAYLKVLQVTAFIALPLMGLIIVLAFDFTKLILGEKWMPIVPAMQVLACWASVYAINSTIWPLFRGIGRPDLETKLRFASLILLVLLIIPFTSRWGMLGTALAVFINVTILSPVIFIKIMKILECQAREILKKIVLPLISVSIMAGLLFVTKKAVFKEVNIISFTFLVIFGSAIYLCFMKVIDILTNYGMRDIVMDHIVTMRKKV